MRHYFSKFVAALMVLAATLLLIFGSKPGSFVYRDGRPVPADYTIVTYWEKWSREEAAGMQRIVDRYNEGPGRTKKVFVQFVSVSQIDQKTLISTAGGNPPDIAGLWALQMGTFTAYGALTPLPELVNDGTIGPDIYKPYVWNLCAPVSAGGVPYAVANTPATVALFWNKDLFREAGLDPEKPPQSIAELDEMSEKLTVIDENGNILRTGFLPNFPGWWDYCWGNFFGNTLWDPSTDTFHIDTPANIQAFKWYQGYTRKLGTKSVQTFDSGFGQFASPQNPFMSNKVAMCLQGSWFVNYIENYTPRFADLNFTELQKRYFAGTLTREEMDLKVLESRDLFRQHYGAALPPNSFGKPGDSLIGDLDVWAIPRGAKHVAEAMDVLRFFTQQDNMEALCRSHCKPSPLINVSDEFFRMHPSPYITIFDDMIRSQQVAVMPVSPNWNKAYDEIRNGYRGMWKTPESFPVEATLKANQIVIDGYRAEYLRSVERRKAATKEGQ